MAKTPSQTRLGVNSMMGFKDLDELTETRKEKIGVLDRYGRLVTKFSELVSQTESTLGHKFDLPSAS